MAVPVVTSITPGNGAPAGGTVVSITGTNLATATAVYFGAVAATVFASLSATQVVADAPAGTGTVHVTVTTAGGTSATSNADLFAYMSGLFTVAEARAFDKGQMDSDSFSDAQVVAKEAEIRELFERVCGVNFIPTVHTDEYHNGDGSRWLMLEWPMPTAISAVSVRTDLTWTALTAGELLQLQANVSGSVYWINYFWWPGAQNVKVTYTAGYSSVPNLVKRAALQVAAYEMPTSNLSPAAQSYDLDGVSLSFMRADGFNNNWHTLPDVAKVLRLYSYGLMGVS